MGSSGYWYRSSEMSVSPLMGLMHCGRFIVGYYGIVGGLSEIRMTERIGFCAAGFGSPLMRLIKAFGLQIDISRLRIDAN
jgi:hypothetical protein